MIIYKFIGISNLGMVKFIQNIIVLIQNSPNFWTCTFQQLFLNKYTIRTIVIWKQKCSKMYYYDYQDLLFQRDFSQLIEDYLFKCAHATKEGSDEHSSLRNIMFN